MAKRIGNWTSLGLLVAMPLALLIVAFVGAAMWESAGLFHRALFVVCWMLSAIQMTRAFDWEKRA